MKLSEIKKHLNQLDTIEFKLPNGDLVPSGLVERQYIIIESTNGTLLRYVICDNNIHEKNNTNTNHIASDFVFTRKNKIR